MYDGWRVSDLPNSVSSRVMREGQLSVKKVASSRLISGSVWKRRYCVLSEFTTALSTKRISVPTRDLTTSEAASPANPNVLGELLIYKLPKRPTGPDDALHDSITIRDCTLLVKETTKQPILHIVTQDGHAMATKSIQFDNLADLDVWTADIQRIIDGSPADGDSTAVGVVPFESVDVGLSNTVTHGAVDSASPKPSARPLPEGDRRNGAASPTRLASLAAGMRSLGSSGEGATGAQNKTRSPSDSPKKSDSPGNTTDTTVERAERERSIKKTLKNSTPSMSGELGGAMVPSNSVSFEHRALRSLSAASDDSIRGSGTDSIGMSSADVTAESSNVRQAPVFSTPAAVIGTSMIASSGTSGPEVPRSDARPSRGLGARVRGANEAESSTVAKDISGGAAVAASSAESASIDAMPTRRGPSLRRGSNGNSANSGKLSGGATTHSVARASGLSTPIVATPNIHTNILSRDDQLGGAAAAVSGPVHATTPAASQTADRLDVPALFAPRVDAVARDTPRAQGRLDVAGPNGLGTSTEFGASKWSYLPMQVQKTTFAEHTAPPLNSSKGTSSNVRNTGKAEELTSIASAAKLLDFTGEISPLNSGKGIELTTSSNKVFDSIPFPAITTGVKDEIDYLPAKPSIMVSEAPPNQDEYSLYALELDALKQMNGELNSALLAQEKKFALETSNMSSKLRVLYENEALLKARCEGLEKERTEWLATEARLSKQVVDLTADVEQRRREAGAMSAPTAQVDSDHASVVSTLTAELTAARNDIVRLKNELDEERVKRVALESKSASYEETLRMREAELKEAESAVSDYKSQLDELRHRLRGSLNSKMDLQSRLSAEMHEELMGDTVRMLSVEKEKAGLEASLEICRNELHKLTKDNEDLKAKLTLKEMYLTALSKESQEGKIKFLEDELLHLRNEIPGIEAQKRRLADELEASQKSLFEERSKSISLNEDCLSLRSQLRQKESELAVAESDASNRTRHLTLEISRLNDDVALLTRQLDSYRLSSEKSEKAFSEQQSRYINEKFLWARSNSELQHSLDAAHSTVQSLQSKLASANDESKHEIARLISRNKELEDTFEALNQSIGTLRQKLSTSEHRIETLQQSVANQSSALSTLENTLSSNELSYKRDIDRYLSKISELQCMVDKSQQNELEAKRRVSDMELQRCNDEMHMSISNQDLTSKLAALAKDIERHKEESTLLKTELTVLRAQSNDSIASLRNTVAQLEDSKKALERDLQDATQRLGMSTRRCDEMAEEQGKLTTLAGEAVRTRVELEDVNHRLVSAQRRIEELQSSEAQLKGAIKEASIARGQSETRENELLRLYESARHDAEDLNKRWMESQSLCDGIAKERDELRSECSASKEQIAELDARLTTLSRQHEEVKANHKIVAEQSLKRHRALKKTQAALTEVQVRLNEAVERESQSRDECNDLKAKLASSRMEHEMAVAHANNLQASLEASRQDCAVLSDALMFAKTESSNLLSIKDSMNAELNCRVRALEERLHEMGCQMDGMVSKELHLKSEQEWRDVSAHYDERFKEHNDQFSAAALIIEGCCSRLSRSLVHDDLCEVMSRALPDNRRYTIQPTYSPSTSPEARLRIALESMQQCTDAVIDASIGASGVVASLLNYLINSTNSRPHLSARNNGSEEDKDLESSFDKIWVIDDDSDDVFGADNIANMPYLGTTFGLIRENAAFNKTRSPRRSQSADSTVLSPSASRPEVTASSMGLMVLAGSVKELSELHMNTAARRKLENDRIDAKKSEKYRNMKESMAAKIESMKRALDTSLSSHESETEQWEAQVTALKSLVDSAVSERDELRRENSNYLLQVAQMKNEIADLSTDLRESALDLQRAECELAQEIMAKKEMELLLRRNIVRNSAPAEASYLTGVRHSKTSPIDPVVSSHVVSMLESIAKSPSNGSDISPDDDSEAKDGEADSTDFYASMPYCSDDFAPAISNAVTLVASHDGRLDRPTVATARAYSSVNRNDESVRSKALPNAKAEAKAISSDRIFEAAAVSPAHSDDDAHRSSNVAAHLDQRESDSKDDDDDDNDDDDDDVKEEEEEEEELLTFTDRAVAEAKSYSPKPARAISAKEVKQSDVPNRTIQADKSKNNIGGVSNQRRSNLRDWMESKSEYKSQSSFRFDSDSDASDVEDTHKHKNPSKSPMSGSVNSYIGALGIKSTDAARDSDPGRSSYNNSRKQNEPKPIARSVAVDLDGGDDSSSGSGSPQVQQQGIGISLQARPQGTVPLESRGTAQASGSALTNGSYLRAYNISRSITSSSIGPSAALTDITTPAVASGAKTQEPMISAPKDTSSAAPRLSLRERLNLHRGI